MFNRLRTYLREKYQSLIFRILLYFLISVLAVAFVLGWNFANRIKPRFENDILPNLSQYVQYIVADIGSPPDLEKAKALTTRLPFELRIEGPGADWASSVSLRTIDHYRFRPAPYPYHAYQTSRRHHDHLLLVSYGDFQFMFSVDSSFRSGSQGRHGLLFVLLGGILVILYFAIRRLFKPLGDISAHLQKIGSGELDDSLEIKGKSELAQLGQGINQMTVDIRTMLESKAGLLLAISHELRSPMTRMRVNLELIKDGKIRTKLVQDIQEMEDLVSAILESERLNTRHAVLNRTKFDLACVIETVIEQNFDACRIDARLPSTQVFMDETRMRLLIKNLIENACRHSSDTELPVKVGLERLDQRLLVSVVDHGPGVNAEELPYIADPFYRTDSARQRKTGGYGLGLYLCKLIVEAHQGQLKIMSESGQGLSVVAIFPVE